MSGLNNQSSLIYDLAGSAFSAVVKLREEADAAENDHVKAVAIYIYATQLTKWSSEYGTPDEVNRANEALEAAIVSVSSTRTASEQLWSIYCKELRRIGPA